MTMDTWFCQKKKKSQKHIPEKRPYLQQIVPNQMSACKKTQIEPYLSPWIKLNLKRVKDFNIKLDSLKLIEEKMENSIEFIGQEKTFSAGHR